MQTNQKGRRSKAAAVLLALTTLGAASLMGSTTAASADTAGNLVVTRATTPTQSTVAPNGPLTGLHNLDVVTIDVTATGLGTAPANNIIYGMDARLCRSGLNILNTAQFNASAGNCISDPLSSGSSAIVQQTFGAPNTSGTLSFIVGTGTETVHNGPGAPITCDVVNPCSLWLKQSVPTGVVSSGNAFVHYDLFFAGAPGQAVAPAVAIGDRTVVESAGSQVLQVPLTLNRPSPTPVSVNVATVNATAVDGSDFTAVAPTTVTFAPGEVTKNVPLTVLGDDVPEKSEKLTVALSAPVGLTLGDTKATVNILDDDAPISVYVSDPALPEGNSGSTDAVFNVSLSRPVPVGATVTVPVATSSSSAMDGVDFTGVTETLTFVAGEQSKTVDVPVSGDSTVEKNETFGLKAVGIVGGVSGDAAGKATIINDDSAPVAVLPSVTITDATAVEGDTTAVVTVGLATAQATPVSVGYTVVDGTAVAPGDYTAVAPGTVTFAPGETSKTVSIPVVGDAAPEKAEKLTVKLSGVTGAVLGDTAAVVNVLDNDAPLSLSVADRATLEGTGGTKTVTFTLALSAPVPFGSTVTVNAASADGSAKSALGDYTVLPATPITFTAGQSSKTVTVTITGDSTLEANETVKLALSGLVGASAADASALATIVNDD